MYQVGPSSGPEWDMNNQADRFDSSQLSDLQGCVKQVHILWFQSRYNTQATPGNQHVFQINTFDLRGAAFESLRTSVPVSCKVDATLLNYTDKIRRGPSIPICIQIEKISLLEHEAVCRKSTDVSEKRVTMPPAFMIGLFFDLKMKATYSPQRRLTYYNAL
jgi:hypothetical protein